MKKNKFKLTENGLKKLIKESTAKFLKEMENAPLCCNNEGLNKNKNRKTKLTESQLRNIIKESVKGILKEGHWNSAVYDEFSELREMLGDDTLISEMYNWMDGDSIEQFIKRTKQMYDLNGYDEEEDDDTIL